MNTLKPIRRLFFQFGALLTAPRLDAYQIFEALQDAGLVTLKSSGAEERPTHYALTESAREIPSSQFLKCVRQALRTYCERKLRKPSSFLLPVIRDVRLTSSGDWHGFLHNEELEPWMRSGLKLRLDDDLMIRVEGTYSVGGRKGETDLDADTWLTLSIDSLGSSAPVIRAELSSFDGARLEEELAHEFPYAEYWEGQDEAAQGEPGAEEGDL